MRERFAREDASRAGAADAARRDGARSGVAVSPARSRARGAGRQGAASAAGAVQAVGEAVREVAAARRTRGVNFSVDVDPQ